MKRIIAFVLSIAALIALKLLFFPGRESAKSNDKGKSGKKPVVDVVVLKKEVVDIVVTATAGLKPREELDLSAETGGRIRKLFFTEGTWVEKGSLLVKLSDDELQAQLSKQMLNKKMIAQRLARMEKLLAVNGTSQEAFDLLQHEADVTDAEIAYIRSQIAKTEIKAPFSGITGLRSVSEGTVVQAGMPLVHLVQQNPLLLDFSIPERYAAQIDRKGQVSFRVNGLDGRYSAKIIAVQPAVQEDTRSLTIRAEFINNGYELLPGMSATATLQLQKNDEALMIPTQAVIPVLKGQKVFVRMGGKAKEVKIKTGLRQAEKIEVLEGLKEGDSLIVTGIMSLRDDIEVGLKEKNKPVKQ